MYYLNRFFIFVGQMGNAPKKAAPDADGGDAAAGGGLFGNMLYFLPAMFMILIVYFLLMSRPQQKQQAKAKELLESIKKNDRVLTAGGILGTVINSQEDSDYITLRVDESSNAKMQILKTSIVRVVTDDGKKDAKSS